MRWGLTILGAIMLLMGGIWFLQGIRILPGSFMTGSVRWTVIGAVVAVIGIALLVRARRRSGA